MAINTGKVVVGGLAAGVVLTVAGFLVQGMLLGPRMMAEMVAAAPTLAGKGEDAMSLAIHVICQFIVGVLLVWLYAAMRPRFGPGPRTAMYAALAIWICGVVFYIDWWLLGMMMASTYVMVSVAMLVILGIAGWVGGMLYKEEGA